MTQDLKSGALSRRAFLLAGAMAPFAHAASGFLIPLGLAMANLKHAHDVQELEGHTVLDWLAVQRILLGQVAVASCAITADRTGAGVAAIQAVHALGASVECWSGLIAVVAGPRKWRRLGDSRAVLHALRDVARENADVILGAYNLDGHRSELEIMLIAAKPPPSPVASHNQTPPSGGVVLSEGRP